MTEVATVPQQQEFAFTDADFQRIAALVRTDFGINLPDSKKPLVYSRLARRLRATRQTSFHDYIVGLLDTGDPVERQELLSALTTNVTQFFREAHHFTLLREHVFSSLAARARAGDRIRIWSAGCSSGQEPYSIAMTLLDALPEAPRLNIKILATDIDPVVVDRARAAIYPMQELQGIPANMRTTWTHVGASATQNFEINAPARAMITFATLNLVGPWPMKGPFDVIFCRNVAIYFDQETQKRLWAGFASVMAESGLLMIGHSERICDALAPQFKTVGVTAYRRTSAGLATSVKRGIV